jgi:hypothetical protein
LCEDAPCLSPSFRNYYIKTPEDYFLALNDLCEKNQAPDRIIDRHVAAFLSVRDRQMIDTYAVDINSPLGHVKALAVLRVLAKIQSRGAMGKVSGLSNWVVDNLSKHLLERLHDRELRVKVDTQLRKMASSGDIVAMAALFESDSALRQDQPLYLQASAQYQNLLNEENVLGYNISHNKRYGHGTGREVASIVSAAASFVIILMTLFWFFGERLAGG